MLLSVLSELYKCQRILYRNVYDNLISNKIHKAGNTRSTTVY